MDTCETIKVKPWGKDQGAFVEINAEDFDPKIHTLSDPLDHDGNGKKGGSLPDHVHVPADYEVDGRPAPSEAKSRRKKAAI